VTRRQFKGLRLSIGYSQAKLAREMGITVRTISRWEQADFPIPKVAALALWAVVTGAKKKRGG
jgi:transcriptional regulator with XRE-family HTH domain